MLRALARGYEHAGAQEVGPPGKVRQFAALVEGVPGLWLGGHTCVRQVAVSDYLNPG